jgi:hypothetical protein
LHRLSRPVERAPDWCWLVDHTALLGRQRLLVVLGVRQRAWAARARAGRGALGFADVRLLHLAAVEDPDGPTVNRHLEALAARAGAPPRSIVSDRGADVLKGIRLFGAGRPGVAEVCDFKHFAANRLKALLQAEPAWAAFQTRLGQSRAALQQTEWAFVVPPALRTKSRYLNLDVLLRRAAKARALLDLPQPERAARGGVARLENALGWLRGMGGALAEWGEWLALSEEAVRSVRQEGLHAGAAGGLGQRLAALARTGPGRGLAAALTGFVAEQQARAKRGERLVGSTEVLESLLGRFKALAREHSRGGVTALALGMGALLGAPCEEELAQALGDCSTADVRAWVRANLTPNIQKRRCWLASLLPRRKKTPTEKDRPAA